MECYECSQEMMPVTREVPFTIGRSTVIILSGLPVFECWSCGAHALDESVMERVTLMIENLPSAVHLQILRYGG